MKRVISLMDKYIIKGEKIGFKVANLTHKVAVNIILIGTAYCIYSTIRDYNDNFKEERVRSRRELEIEGRVNSKEDD